MCCKKRLEGIYMKDCISLSFASSQSDVENSTKVVKLLMAPQQPTKLGD